MPFKNTIHYCFDHAMLRAFSLVFALSLVLAGCGGGGGGSSPTPAASPTPTPTPTPTPVPGVSVSVTGRITFDSVPFSTATDGLDFSNTTQAPVRGVIVEALNSTNTSAAVLASATTDASGGYGLVVPANTNVIIRAKAQMLSVNSGATWNYRVLNNANGDALYALDSLAFNTGTADITNKNLNAASGWDGTTYSDTRAAAPFAILDTVYNAVQLISGAQAATTFPPLNIFWSTSNKTATPFCPTTGAIETTAFHTSDLAGNCVSQTESAGGIYVLGDFAAGNGDTDEFDTHVIAHEFGHYVEHSFSRVDSLGGEHGGTNKLDLRVAMSEGWGNAFSGMTFNDPIYRDSRFHSGQSAGFTIDVSAPNTSGWYSESTVQYLLWSFFSEPNLGFSPILHALEGGQKETPALTSIFSFLAALEAVVPGSASTITQLADDNGVNSVDPFGAGETNNGGDATVLPIYDSVPKTVCSSAANGSYNRLGNRKFFKIVTSSASTLSITVTATSDGAGTVAAVDPNFLLWSAGTVKINATSSTTATESGSALIPAGTYVLEVYDFAYNDPDNSPPVNSPLHCMSVSVTGL